MKIIHTGDWHIGKIINEFSMLEDQEFILNQFISIIEAEKPHVLVIAGDLYDRSIPSVEAVELLDKTFNSILLDLKIPIIAIAGNHDSAERLSFGSKILNQNGLYMAGIFEEKVKKIVLQDEYGPVNFYLVPYADPRVIKHILEDEVEGVGTLNHDMAMKKVIEIIKSEMNENEKNVMVAHGYVTFMSEKLGEAPKTSDSERPLSIGGTDLINGEYFNCFNYTALGHLHSPQKIGSDKMRYSGSLLKYSFSETNHKKGITIVDMNEKGEVTTQFKELIPKRDMRIIKGPLSELIDPKIYGNTNVEDYICAILTDEGELIDPISKLRAVYPNIMELSRENIKIKEDSKTSASFGYDNKSKLQLFEEFYKSISGEDITREKLQIVEEVIQAVEKDVK